ncbi:hypothetical protein ACHQM5_021511 [Ranunculus cassubicifolius]
MSVPALLRINWTAPMDRYFVDLMLEQLTRDSRFDRVDGHLFSKRAWGHMILLFNEKFQMRYNLDHLKNRNRTLKKVHATVKHLLEQKGFTWDETQHMVIASDRRWSNYIKAHPEARSYRTRSIPYYRDICTIFENATSEKHDDSTHKQDPTGGDLSSSTHVSHEDPSDDEQESLSICALDEQQSRMPTISSLSPNGDTADTLQENVIDGSNGNRSRTYWQPPMDKYFIQLMKEQVRQGNQFDGIFHKQAWIHMTELFDAKFGFNYDILNLKNRYKTLKRQYTTIKILLEQKGFTWDETLQRVTADDHVWHDYIKTHPEAKQYATRPVPYFNDLSLIFKELNVHEQNEVPETEQPSSSKRKFDEMCEKQNNHQVVAARDHVLQRSSGESMANAVREMAAVVASLSEKRSEPNNNNNFSSIEDVICAVQEIPDMDDELILDACDFLEDEKKAKMFLLLDVRLRKRWLMRKLRPNL